MVNNEIPIKVRTNNQINKQDIQKAVNLNNGPAEKTRNKPRGSRFWLFLSLILFLGISGLSAKLFLFNHQAFSGYQQIIPQDAKVAVLFKLSRLENMGLILSPEFEQNSQLFRWLKDKISLFLKESSLSIKQDLAPIFDQDALFLLLPSSNSQANWALIGRLKNPRDQQDERVFTRIEDGLRRGYGLNQIVYRQTEINSVYAFNQINKPYFYAQVNNFILIGNNMENFQKLIDRIIGD